MFSSEETLDRVRESNFDWTVMEYNGYYKFTDKNYFKELLQSISPGFNLEGEPVSIKSIIDDVTLLKSIIFN